MATAYQHKIESFTSESIKELEININRFLETNKSILGIQFTSTSAHNENGSNIRVQHHALVFYSFPID